MSGINVNGSVSVIQKKSVILYLFDMTIRVFVCMLEVCILKLLCCG